jgi:hypothetical protein
MGDLHVQRLRKVRGEYDTVRVCGRFVAANQHDQRVLTVLRPSEGGILVLPRDLERTELALEKKYLVRLWAEFEGLLKDHLRERRPAVVIPDSPRVQWLISMTFKSPLSLSRQHLSMLTNIRKYRNDLVHSEDGASTVTFREALSCLSNAVSRLP